MPFAENLRRLRRERLLTQTKLAKLAGMHQVTVTKLERSVTTPRFDTIRRLAAALGVQPSELIQIDELADRTLGLAA